MREGRLELPRPSLCARGGTDCRFTKNGHYFRLSSFSWYLRGTTYYNRGCHRLARKERADADFRTALASFEEAIRLNPALEGDVQKSADACRRYLGTRPDE